MNKTALVTGLTGQDGSHLADILLGRGYTVHGMIRRASTDNLGRIRHLLDNPRLVLHYGDLCDGVGLRGIVKEAKADLIFNLAAHSHVPAAFRQPVYASMVDAVGTMQILESVRDECPEARFYQACSSEQYGAATETPQNEDTPFRPRSPYACAKVFSFYQTRNYREAYNMFASNGILFNHEGARRGAGFVTRKITLAACRIKLGLQKRLTLGNLDAKRDWGYAPEYCEAMLQMLELDKPDDFVIATGRTETVREFARLAFAVLDMNWEDYVDLDNSCLRPAEVVILQGDASKAKRTFGWQARTTLEQLVEIMVKSDFDLVSKEKASGYNFANTTEIACSPKTV